MQNKIETSVNRIMQGHIAHDIELGIRYESEMSEGVRMTLPWAQFLTEKEGDGAIGPGALITLSDTISGIATMASLQFCESTATMDLRVDFKCSPPPGSACVAYAQPVAVLGDPGRGSVIVHSSVQAAETKETIAFSVGRFIRKPLLPDKAPPAFSPEQFTEVHALDYQDLMQFTRRSDGTFVMPYRPGIVGNGSLPSLHGGALAAHLQAAAVEELAHMQTTRMRLATAHFNYLRYAGAADTIATVEVERLGRSATVLRAQSFQKEGFVNVTASFLFIRM